MRTYSKLFILCSTGIISELFTSLFSEVQDQYLRDLASQLPQAILKSKADNTVSKYLLMLLTADKFGQKASEKFLFYQPKISMLRYLWLAVYSRVIL